MAHKYNKKLMKVVYQNQEQRFKLTIDDELISVQFLHQVILELFLCPRHNISPPDLQGADQPEEKAGYSLPKYD